MGHLPLLAQTYVEGTSSLRLQTKQARTEEDPFSLGSWGVLFAACIADENRSSCRKLHKPVWSDMAGLTQLRRCLLPQRVWTRAFGPVVPSCQQGVTAQGGLGTASSKCQRKQPSSVTFKEKCYFVCIKPVIFLLSLSLHSKDALR